MLIQHIGFRIKGFYRIARLTNCDLSISNDPVPTGTWYKEPIMNSKHLLPHTRWGNQLYWKTAFKRRFRRSPNIEAPQRMSDHLYRIKTDGRLLDPLYQFITDKEHSKLYVKSVLGGGFTPETLAILRTDEDVDSMKIKRVPCVLKPTHASGEVLFYRNAEDIVDRCRLKAWLRFRYYPGSREDNYRYLTPKVIVEEFFSDGSSDFPKDYKVYCFSGVPKMIGVFTDRSGSPWANYYDNCWNALEVEWSYPRGMPDVKPPMLPQMLDAAARLAAPFPFVRVDLYASATEIRVGELTFLPNAANNRIQPDSTDFQLGQLFDD